MRETGRNGYQTKFMRLVSDMYPNCLILKSDPNYIQGIPDILILEGNHWAALEVKRNSRAPHRPNQDWYVERMNDMSYSSFVYPENESTVIHDIQRAFGSPWKPRISQRQ